MGKNSGYVCSIDTGGKAIAKHREQEQAFRDAKKVFIHYMDDEYQPIMVEGKEKTGLMDSARLKVIGMFD